MTLPAFDTLGIWNWERPDINDEIEYAKYADDIGFDSVCQGESRLVRDAMTVLGAYTQVTDDVTIATGVTNCYRRNVALMAQTCSTLHELSDRRAKLGIGAWWDPLAAKVGIDRSEPLRRMWEYTTVTCDLLDLENVTYEGQTLSLDGVELDLVRSDPEPRDVPILVGATGMMMNEMSGKLVGKGIVDGVMINYLIPPSHNERAVEKLTAGVESENGSIDDVDRPQLIAVSMDEDVDAAIDAALPLVTQYIGQQPHIRKACGIDPDLGMQIEAELGGWPADAADIERAGRLVPDDIVQNIVAAGTPRDCVECVGDYCDSGCTEPVLYSLGDNVKEMMNVFETYKVDL